MEIYDGLANNPTVHAVESTSNEIGESVEVGLQNGGESRDVGLHSLEGVVVIGDRGQETAETGLNGGHVILARNVPVQL